MSDPVQPSQAPIQPGFVERRRPGRREKISPELIPLLRGQFEVQPQPEPPHVPEVEAEKPDDDRGAAWNERLVWLALLLSVMLWGAMQAGWLSWLV